MILTPVESQELRITARKAADKRATHLEKCPTCPDLRKDYCATGLVLTEAFQALAWALDEAEALEDGARVHYRGSIPSAYGEGWTVKGRCCCNLLGAYPEARFRIVHDDGRSLRHVRRTSITLT